MPTEELARATAEFDQEFVGDTFSPLTSEDCALWERIKPKRSRNDFSARTIAVDVENGLLTRCDALAKKLGILRATLIARGLKAILAAQGEI